MAQAIVTSINSPAQEDTTTIRIRLSVIFNGVDVPGVVEIASVDVKFAVGSTAAQLANAVQAAVQSYANLRGYTVPTNSLLVPSYQRL